MHDPLSGEELLLNPPAHQAEEPYGLGFFYYHLSHCAYGPIYLHPLHGVEKNSKN